MVNLPVSATEYHVSIKGLDSNPGSSDLPFRTISYAAQVAGPGDTITVHAGIYREEVRPNRGGTADDKRILYRVAPGEKVEIKGSEIIKNWQLVQSGVWKVVIPDGFFGSYNPYAVLISGDWYSGRYLHTGEIYLDGKCLHEVDSLEKVLEARNGNDLVGVDSSNVLDGTYNWYCTNEKGQTTLYANFHHHDPNEAVVEINVRQSCFYPQETGRNYITVRGFDMSQAATQWAAPTAEQRGLLGTNWSKGWIIEDNVIHDSKCVGITLGKDRKTGNNGVYYNEVVFRVIANGWNKDTIGSHLVRNNTVYNCGAAGICGSFGAAYSRILNNHVYDIYTYRAYRGAEMGGIKIHAAIDVLIEGNRVHNTFQGIWLDWMAQGTRVSANLCYNNDFVDFFPEVDHGPYLVDNNLFLSPFSIKDWSEGGAYVHNLIVGMVSRDPQQRVTPFFKPHTTQWVDTPNIKGGDNRYYNNIFIGTRGKPFFKRTKYMSRAGVDTSSGYGLSMYDSAAFPVWAVGNVYLNGALPFKGEARGIDADPEIRLVMQEGAIYLHVKLDSRQLAEVHSKLVTTLMLGKAKIPDQNYENPDGTALQIDRDYFGRGRDIQHPTPGPLEQISSGEQLIEVWP